MNPTSTVALVLAALAVLAPSSSLTGVEPNDTPAQATPLAVERNGAPGFLPTRRADGLVVHGRLEPGDVDFYAFAAQAGDLVTAAVLAPDGGAFADPVLALLGPGDAEPVASDDDGGPGFLPRLAAPIDRTGPWMLAVAGFGDEALDGGSHEEDFAYDLVVAVAPQVGGRAEREGRRGNDTPRRAEPLSVPVGGVLLLTGTLEPGDVDYFSLAVPHDALLTASLYDEEAGAYADSQLQVFGFRRGTLAENDDGGPGFLSNVATEAARGRTFLAVSGFDPFPDDARGHPERFRYRLVISLSRDADRSAGPLAKSTAGRGETGSWPPDP